MMSEAAEFLPQWAVAPGLTISHVLSQRGMSYDQLAAMLHRPTCFVTDLVVGRQEITEELAEALARTIGSTSRFWLARDREYREALNRLASQDSELQEWVSTLPVRDMQRFGWLRGTSGCNLVAECLRFFGVCSLARWKECYEASVLEAAFRMSAAYETNPASVSVWLRQGEVEAAGIETGDWNPELFRKSLPRIRQLTRTKLPATFMPQLQRICADAGVAVVVVAAPMGCRASGAARFLSSRRALIQLSLRYRTDDQFWFTFFHEAGHLLLHSREDLFIDGLDQSVTREEEEANTFASRVLLTDAQRDQLLRLPLLYRAVIRFAREAGVSPGIVVGQLQFLKRVDFSRLNRAKRKLDWSSLGYS